MSVDTTKFTLPLVKAINSWQSGSRGKERKARQLQRAAQHLGDVFRSPSAIAYRNFRLNKSVVLPMANHQKIAEAISSWTSSLEVAKHFQENKFDRQKIGLIYARVPTASDVILNLNHVYADQDFMATVNYYEQNGLNCQKGIREYAGSQCEVILDETDMRNDEIAFVGAYRNLADVVPLIGPRSADAEPDEVIMKKFAGVRFNEIFWAGKASADAAMKRYIERARELLHELPRPIVWDASDTEISEERA